MGEARNEGLLGEVGGVEQGEGDAGKDHGFDVIGSKEEESVEMVCGGF